MDSLSSQVRSTPGLNSMTPSAPPAQKFPRCTGQLTISQMEALGFQIVGEIDHWFLEVQLPEGWYKERDRSHPGWWLICDQHDRLRCQSMEGHANYTTLMANWLRRYDYDVQWHPYEPCRLRWIILDGGDILLESGWSVGRPERMVQFAYAHVKRAVAYLTKKFPQWRSLDAYW